MDHDIQRPELGDLGRHALRGDVAANEDGLGSELPQPAFGLLGSPVAGPTFAPDGAFQPTPAGFALARPVAAAVSSPFGPRTIDKITEFHDGTDFAGSLGAPVVAAAPGVVVAAGRIYLPSDDAVVVIVDHGNGLQTLYGHLAPALAVRVGQRVEAGTVLGVVGLTGRITGPHLHFGLMVDGRFVDAARFFAEPL